MSEELKPTWKNTFNSWHRMWGHVSKAAEAAVNSGYPYIAWNGWVFDVNELAWDERICPTSELDKELA